MAWSADLQETTDRLIAALIERCQQEIGRKRTITPQTEPCRQLGICEEDLDDLQINAAKDVGLRPPLRGEPLVIPWHGPNMPSTIADLAGWLAANGRPLA
ncbi:MAG: hypothetical protein EOP19_29295 [Hyphomicrobiales bacterium]|nr:MAG: hypothetical protein EOP19_29295 [Hyphomicrobiales bacterium]